MVATDEYLWKQWSQTDWLREGEKNMAFFKAKATHIRKKKLVNSTTRDDSRVLTKLFDIISEFTNFYASMFHRGKISITSKLWKILL